MAKKKTASKKGAAKSAARAAERAKPQNVSEIRGHAATLQLLATALGRGRLPHGLLFVGPGGVGKTRVAAFLAKCLFCPNTSSDELAACGECESCRQVDAGTHPDLLVAERIAGKRDLTIDVFLGAKDKRGREGLLAAMALSPMQADRKVAIVRDADRMNVEAANALLKTLEEPPPRSVLVLVAESPEDLLPTIRSRCQQIRFGPLADGDVAALLETMHDELPPGEAEGIAALAGGSLDIAGQLLDPALRELRDMLFQAFARPPLKTPELAKSLGDRLGKVGDAAAKREAVRWLLRFAFDFLRRSLLAITHGEPAEAAEVRHFLAVFRGEATDTLERLARIGDRLAEADAQVLRLAPVDLVLEGLFDDINRIVAGKGALYPKPLGLAARPTQGVG